VALGKAYGGTWIRSDKSSDAEEVVRQVLCSEGLFMIHLIENAEVKAHMTTFSDNSIKLMNTGYN
jgi:hypothetical protein